METPAAIEQVLSLGKKQSTYKIAVLRALVDYVIEQPAQEPRNGFHRIPILEIARKVLVYYWRPALSRVPQGTTGQEAIPAAITKLANSQLLLQGVDLQATSAGLALGEWITGAVALEKPLLDALLDVRAVLLEQPIQYLHNLPGQRVSIFSLLTHGCPATADYEQHRKEAGGKRNFRSDSWLGLLDEETTDLVISARSYEEISQLRYWLRDAIVLRWARECERYGAKGLSVETFALEPLGRNAQVMSQVRSLYQTLNIDRCVYSDTRLPDDWHLDHLLPVSRFPVNLFWNLVPSTPTANLRKSDLLPEITPQFKNRYAELVGRCLSSGDDLINQHLQLTSRRYFQQRQPEVDLDPATLWGLVDRNWARLEQAGVGIWTLH